MKKPLLTDLLLNNIYFDTCVYHQPGIDLVDQGDPYQEHPVCQRDDRRVRGIDPETGFYYDDTKRYIEASSILSSQDKRAVYEGNARLVFSRLDAALKAKGK